MKILKRVGIFFLTLCIYVITFDRYFPKDETGVTLAPDWYYLLGFGISVLASLYKPIFNLFINRSARQSFLRIIIVSIFAFLCFCVSLAFLGVICAILFPTSLFSMCLVFSLFLSIFASSVFSIMFSRKLKTLQSHPKHNKAHTITTQLPVLEPEVSTAPTVKIPEGPLIVDNIENQNTPVVYDDLLLPAIDAILESGNASVSMIQRHFSLGYARASRIIDELEEIGIIGSFQGSQPRSILITKSEWVKRRGPVKYSAIQKSSIDSHYSVSTSHIDSLHKYGGIPAELMTIDLMEGHDFEYWCAEALRNIGYTEVEVTKGSGDQGVDILATKDGIKFAFQCKRYNSTLGNTPVQEVFAGKSFYGCHACGVITNQYFTPGAKELANKTGVVLWDRDWIIECLRRKYSNSI